MRNIGDGAFRGCINLSTIECEAFEPPTARIGSFDNENYNSAKLFVPMYSIGTYQKNVVWGKFNISSLSVMISTIILNPDKWYGEEGESFQLIPTIYPEDATNKRLKWISSDDSMATVDENGMVTVHRAGNCVITAYSTDGSGAKASCELDIISGIDDIIVDSDTKVEVFTLQGLKFADSLDGLAPGVYIVRQGSKTYKVVSR